MSDLAWHFVVRDVERASAWYGDVFGATETSRVTLPDATVMTADLRIGDAVIAIGRELPQWGVLSPESLGGTYGALHVRVDDVDAVWDSAMTGGATPFEPVHDAFWGVRTGQLIDPFGHRWALDQPLRDVPPRRCSAWPPRLSPTPWPPPPRPRLRPPPRSQACVSSGSW